jgi:teichuronic acid exporter
VQHVHSELRRYFLVLTELLCYLAFPVSLGIAVTADLLVAIVLGPQWDAVVAPLRILCIYSAFYSSQMLIGHLLLWTGRFRANMWCSILAAILLPSGCYFGAQWGLEGVAWAWVVVFPIMNVPAFVISFRAIGIRLIDWLAALMPALVSCLAMMAIVWVVRQLVPDLAAPLQAAVSVAAGAIGYVAVLVLSFPRRVKRMFEFLTVIRGSGSVPGEAALTS